MTEAELAEFQASAKLKRDAYSDHWRRLCEERGVPIPRRRPGTFRFKMTPSLQDDEEAAD